MSCLVAKDIHIPCQSFIGELRAFNISASPCRSEACAHNEVGHKLAPGVRISRVRPPHSQKEAVRVKDRVFLVAHSARHLKQEDGYGHEHHEHDYYQYHAALRSQGMHLAAVMTEGGI